VFSPEEKRFFAAICLNAKSLSSCKEPKGAALIQGRKILSYGYNKTIIKDKPWEMSAIFDAIFGTISADISGSVLFSSYFPDINDLKLICSSGVSVLYFFGKITDTDSVEFLNSTKDSPISLEVLQLE
jgi:deoxycytidylate deaminase